MNWRCCAGLPVSSGQPSKVRAQVGDRFTPAGKRAVVEFRVTVGLGQDSADVAVLEDRAAVLQDSVDALSGDVDVVDLVKAAVRLVLAVEAEDALAAAHRALGSLDSALATAALSAPASILTVEAEAIPSPSQDHPLRPHAAHSRGSDG